MEFETKQLGFNRLSVADHFFGFDFHIGRKSPYRLFTGRLKCSWPHRGSDGPQAWVRFPVARPTFYISLCYCKEPLSLEALYRRPLIQSSTTNGPICRRGRKLTVWTPLTSRQPLDIPGEAQRAILCFTCARTTENSKQREIA